MDLLVVVKSVLLPERLIIRRFFHKHRTTNTRTPPPPPPNYIPTLIHTCSVKCLHKHILLTTVSTKGTGVRTGIWNKLYMYSIKITCIFNKNYLSLHFLVFLEYCKLVLVHVFWNNTKYNTLQFFLRQGI